MSLDSIKRDLKDYIEENKASLEAWENVTYLTKKDGTPFKSMSKNFTNATYKRKESFRGYILEVDTKFTKNRYFRNYIDCGNKDNPNTLEEIKQKVSEEIESTKRFIKSLEKRLEIIDYAYEEFSKSYDDIRENLKELCEDEEFPLFYAKVQRVNDNDDLIDDDYIFEYDNKPKRSEVEDDFIDEWGQRDLDRHERKMPVPENDIIHMICI